MAAEISDEVRRFILTSIPSVPHLEALLLLRQSASAWNAASLAARLYVTAKKAGELLDELERAGFLQREEGATTTYRYAPASEAQADIVGRTAEAYAEHLVEVTKLIHEGTSTGMQEFAEAFRFRKE